MAQLTRKLMKLFGGSAGTNERAQFGSLAAAAPVFVNDGNIDTIQSLTAWVDGWYAAVIGGNSPSIQDMNGLLYVFAYQLLYGFQTGIPAYLSTETYYKGSLASNNGNVYLSLTDTNTGNALTDTTKWKLAMSPATGPSVIVGDQTTYPYATHATLAAAVADSAVGTNIGVLLLDSQTIAATASLTKAGWRIKAAPGVTYTAGAATTGISVAADGITIEGLRFAGFSVAAISYTVAGTYGRVLNCNFAVSNTASVVDTLAPAGKKSTTIGNVDEI